MNDLKMKAEIFLLILAVGSAASLSHDFASESLSNDEKSVFDWSPEDLSNGIQEREVAPPDLKDDKHGVKMGVSDSECDDAETKLDLDWDGSPINFTCYTPKQMLPVNKNLSSSLECDNIPKDYYPQHVCMDHALTYDHPLPTHADHRPLWAQYGEYIFVPPQRWSHNIEHGAVVMLYHPCAQPMAVKKLKELVRNCIWKHVLTPSNMVPIDRPLVLIAWGCRLRMSYVDEAIVKNFIKNHALHGPEGKYAKEGQYSYMLRQHAVPPSGTSKNSTELCPDIASM